MKTLSEIASQEFIQGLSVALLLVVSQVILSGIGFGGMIFAATLYAAATVASSMFFIDHTGIRHRDEEKLAKSVYLTRCGVNLGLMITGMILWLLVGVIHGIETTISTARSPQDILKKMTGDNFSLKILYAGISHITLFSFCRFFTNLYGLLQTTWDDVFGSGKKGKK